MTRAVTLDISKALDRVWHVGLLYKLRSYWISSQIFNLISPFLSNRRLHKNIQLMLEFSNCPFLVLHFLCCILMTFLMMLSVLILSLLMILLSILTVIKRLIQINNLNWLLNLHLIYETLWTGGRISLLISMLGKFSWFRLTGLITMVLLMWKLMFCSWGKIIF